jgi:GNAT superfamily N-acetyltransferase
MTLTIRPMTAEDYPARAAIINATERDKNVTADELRLADERRDPKCKRQVWLAERDGQAIGLASLSQYPDFYHPHKFWVMVRVIPTAARAGVGAALYETLVAGLRPHDSIALLIQAREDVPDALRFAAKRGFVETGRRWEARLDVQQADLAPFMAGIDALASEGIVLRSIAELAADPDRDRKLYDLQWAADQDVPLPEPITPMSFEQYCRQMLHTPKLAAEGSFVAVDERAGGRYVGLSTFFHNGEGKLEVDITGVAGDYRRRGIAGAIKAQGAAWAKAQGYREISVVNDPVNVGMLRINEKMGFVRQPAIVWLTRTIDAANPL